MVVNYQNGKIYCIRSHQTDDIYIGSTTQELSMRMAGHRKDYKRWKEGKKCYISSYELLQYDDCYIELIEECPCNSKMELERREGKLIRELDCINKCIAGRTKKEYAEEHKENIAQYDKQYRKANKERISQHRNEKLTCECGSVYSRTNKVRHERTKKHQEYISNKIVDTVD
jgi:hypothetical protein